MVSPIIGLSRAIYWTVNITWCVLDQHRPLIGSTKCTFPRSPIDIIHMHTCTHTHTNTHTHSHDPIFSRCTVLTEKLVIFIMGPEHYFSLCFLFGSYYFSAVLCQSSVFNQCYIFNHFTFSALCESVFLSLILCVLALCIYVFLLP